MYFIYVGGLDRFPILFSEFSKWFPVNIANKTSLLLQKGVYPYEYMNAWKRFEEANLPSKESFKNSLKNCNISDVEYAHAQNVWTQFDCKTIQDYHDIYLKTDLLLLADIFETFRKFANSAHLIIV